MLLIAQQAGASQIQAPKTHSELMTLFARREELKGQMGSLNERGQLLRMQLMNDGTNPAAQARLAATDKRVAQLEGDIDRLNEVIAASMGLEHGGNAPEPAAPPADRYTSSASDWGEGMLGAIQYTAPITLASVVLLGVLLYWRISRSLKNQLTKVLAMQQSRLEEIQRSVDTVAVEIERVSENQRYVTKLVGEKEKVS
jgi:hypothetical protein